MKILFMVTRDSLNPGVSGGDIQPWEHARYLASSGHSVTFLTSGFPGAPREQTVEGIKVVRLGRVLTLWLSTFLYYILHCRGKYDLVVEEGFGGSRIPRLAPLYVKEPIVTEWHQIHQALFEAQYPKILVPFLNLLERAVGYLHRNTLVRAGTIEWQEAFPSIGFRKGNIFVVPVSIREDLLDDTAPGHAAEPKFVWLGKFRRYKSPHHVVLAMNEVLSQVPDARLILAGRHDDENYEEHLRRQIDELGIGAHVEFEFNITEERKSSLLKSCRAMVLPSSVEGFGIVVLEANACGMPVIASSGVPESVVQEGNNGLRYPFGDVAALSKCMIRILQDDELHAQLSANSAVFVKQFAWHKVGAQYEDVLKGAFELRAVVGS